MEPGAVPPVEEFPILKFMPGFLAPWKRRIWYSRDETDTLWAQARELIDKRRKLGDVRDCIADHLLEEYEKNGWPMPEYDFNHVLGEIVEGGADTTASQLLTLVLAFAKFPKVQERAREELDRVCGTQRSPAWADFADLPYINATVKEGMRWRPV
jgi:cytochrome P450